MDTSALIAIMRKEPEREPFVRALRQDGLPIMSTASILETTMVASRALSRDAGQIVDEFLQELLVRPIPVTLEQADIARRAFFDYGKGRGTRAQLNFGDCLVYGLAKWAGASVLFKGDDFSGTDLIAAIPRA